MPSAPATRILHPAGGPAHALVAGAEGIDVLAFASGSDTSLTWLPRPNVMFAGPRWLPLDGPHPFAAEEACGPLELPAATAERPPQIVALAQVEAERTAPRRHRDQSTATSARRSDRRAAACRRSSSIPAASPTRRTATAPRTSCSSCSRATARSSCCTRTGPPSRTRCTPATSISRPRRHRRLARVRRRRRRARRCSRYGDRDPRDMCFYPRSGKVSLRGLKVMMRIQRVDYWDGEA